MLPHQVVAEVGPVIKSALSLGLTTGGTESAYRANLTPPVLHHEGVSPGDRDHRPGHIIEQVGGKEFDDPGAILDRTEPPQRDQFGSMAIALTMTADAKSNAWFSSLRLFS